jgi:hypothetical protein
MKCPDHPISLPFDVDFQVGNVTHINNTIYHHSSVEVSPDDVVPENLRIDPYNGMNHFHHIKGLQEAMANILDHERRVLEDRKEADLKTRKSWLKDGLKKITSFVTDPFEDFFHTLVSCLMALLAVWILISYGPSLVSCICSKFRRGQRGREATDTELRNVVYSSVETEAA